jgi:thymidylate synthase
MFPIECRNVNEALKDGVYLLNRFGQEISPRGKKTLEMSEPVSTTYHNPRERVLFLEERDANPFLHLFESLWMLAGRRDLAFLERLTKNFRQYSDDGINMQGSYGYKWRTQFGFDQIWAIIDLLRNDPDTRRAVMTMWSPEDLGLEHDVATGVRGVKQSSDIPCNTNIYFKIRNNELRMTVCNRSNDMIWGAYGANVVHMSLLQEYIANKVGVKVGPYTQISDSFHVYLEGPGGEIWNRLKLKDKGTLNRNLYQEGSIIPLPICATSADWDSDLAVFFQTADSGITPPTVKFRTAWFKEVIWPMWRTFITRNPAYLKDCPAQDWSIVAYEWLERRAQ